MDDTSGIRLLAGLVDILRDKDGSAKLLTRLQAHEDAAAESLQEAKETLTRATQEKSDANAAHTESARLRNEMQQRLVPRETEVRNGAKALVEQRTVLDQRDKDIAQREKELTRRENAAAAREEKIGIAEDTLKGETARVAALREKYETQLTNLKKVVGG